MKYQMILAAALIAVTCVAAAPSSAVKNRYDYTMPRARQISLAMSAAPAPISTRATIYILGPHGFEIARHGTNGFSCLVDRNFLGKVEMSIEPKCFDAEGSRVFLPVSLRMEVLRAHGRSEAQVSADIAAGYKDGRFQAPRKPGLIYMMSSENFLPGGPNNTTFGPVAGHLMFYAPYMTVKDLGYPASADKTLPYLSDPGTPYTMMIVAPK
jgi:hypothetical protein